MMVVVVVLRCEHPVQGGSVKDQKKALSRKKTKGKGSV
jgi:hypothetical protein